MPLATSDGRSAFAPHGVTIVPKVIPTAAHGPNVMQERMAMAVAGKRIDTPFSTSKLNASRLQMANSTNVMAICPRRVSAARRVELIGVREIVCPAREGGGGRAGERDLGAKGSRVGTRTAAGCRPAREPSNLSAPERND